jgi:hypothetical protein
VSHFLLFQLFAIRLLLKTDTRLWKDQADILFTGAGHNQDERTRFTGLDDRIPEPQVREVRP